MKTIRSPYDDGELLLAAPAIRVDAALIHVHRADQLGNTLILSPDPFFDDLLARAADEVFVSTEKLVSTAELGLPANARFLGYSEGIAAYGLGRELRLRRLANGQDRIFRRLEPRFHAQLGRRGLAYGSGRMLGFSVWAMVSGAV